jgi:hypothetical protein
MNGLDKLIERDAKSVVDTMFETKILKSDLTRDNMNSIEEFIAYMMKTRINGYIKMSKLQKTIENHSS